MEKSKGSKQIEFVAPYPMNMCIERLQAKQYRQRIPIRQVTAEFQQDSAAQVRFLLTLSQGNGWQSHLHGVLRAVASDTTQVIAWYTLSRFSRALIGLASVAGLALAVYMTYFAFVIQSFWPLLMILVMGAGIGFSVLSLQVTQNQLVYILKSALEKE